MTDKKTVNVAVDGIQLVNLQDLVSLTPSSDENERSLQTSTILWKKLRGKILKHIQERQQLSYVSLGVPTLLDVKASLLKNIAEPPRKDHLKTTSLNATDLVPANALSAIIIAKQLQQLTTELAKYLKKPLDKNATEQLVDQLIESLPEELYTHYRELIAPCPIQADQKIKLDAERK